jgi:predicted ATPase
VWLLAASRERLGVAGEQLIPLEPLAVPEPGSTEVETAPAVQLFVDRARAVRPAFALTPGNADAVAEVCRRLDGLPLAIELAAARAGAIEPTDLAARLDERFHLLESERRVGPPHHRTLRAVVDWSYGMLGEVEQRVFERASVFAGGFTLATAEAVAAGGGVARERIAALVAGLVDKSMIAAPRAAPTPRYTMLETLCAYGWQRLVERGEADAVTRRFAETMAALAEESAAALPTSEEQEAVERLDLELDNLRAVHRWAVQAGEPDLVLRLVASLFRYGYWRLRREVLQWAEAAATDASAPAHPARPRACAAAVRAQQGGDAQTLVLNLAGQALARAYGGDTTTGAQLSTAAREHAERSDNPTAHAWAAYAWAEVLGADEPDRALAPVEQARATAASVGNEFVAGIAEVTAASLRSRLGNPDDALQGFGDLITRWRDSANWTQQWTTLRNLVELLARLEVDEAAATLYGATTAAREGPRNYGAHAARLRTAIHAARQRLGTDRYAAAIEHGRGLTGDEAVPLAIETIQRLLTERAPS